MTNTDQTLTDPGPAADALAEGVVTEQVEQGAPDAPVADLAAEEAVPTTSAAAAESPRTQCRRQEGRRRGRG